MAVPILKSRLFYRKFGVEMDVIKVRADEVRGASTTDLELAKWAKIKLGYGSLSQMIATSGKIVGKLHEVLLRLEIDILTKESVAAYKADVEAKAQAPSQALQARIDERVRELLSAKKEPIKVKRWEYIGVGASWGTSLLCVCLLCLMGEGYEQWAKSTISTISVIGVLLPILWHFTLKDIYRYPSGPNTDDLLRTEFSQEASSLRQLRWKTSPIRGYPAEIPVAAILKMQRIRELLPKAKFRIHWTAEEQMVYDASNRRIRVAREIQPVEPDPFLEVELKTKDGVESAFIHVWDEPDYVYTAVQDQ